MTGTEVMDIINLICEKAGLAAASVGELIPALARYEVIDNIIGVMFSLIYILAVTAYAVFIIRWSFKKPDDDRFTWDVLLAVLVIIGIFVVTGLMSQISDIFGWIITPETEFIGIILKLLK